MKEVREGDAVVEVLVPFEVVGLGAGSSAGVESSKDRFSFSVVVRCRGSSVFFLLLDLAASSTE
jgi:hypothetical protein